MHENEAKLDKLQYDATSDFTSALQNLSVQSLPVTLPAHVLFVGKFLTTACMAASIHYQIDNEQYVYLYNHSQTVS